MTTGLGGSGLNPPYGGNLVHLVVDDARASAMKATANDFASLTLDDRGLCDLELLAVGGYSPLKSFMGRGDYERVLAESRLSDGTFWPLPITLPVTPGNGVEIGKTLSLRDVYGNLLAFLHVEELYPFDPEHEARAVDGSADMNRSPATHHASGPLEVIRVPPHYDFVSLRRTPAEVRERFESLGWSKVVGFQTSHPIDREDEERARRAASSVGGGLLIHPVVGPTKPGDVAHYTTVRSYRALVDHYFEPDSVVLGLLPYVSRMAGLRETLLHAIIRRNYGCTHLIVERHQARAATDPFDGQKAQQRGHSNIWDEIGIGLVDFKPMVHVPEQDRSLPADEVPTGFRGAVAAILSETNPPRFRQGLTIWFTGLSGSGKSTVAHALVERLAEHGRNVSFLDGDEIRTHLSKGLGFSKEDRDININRVGYVAGLVAQHGGTTLCSVISPYRASRENARKASKGNFVEIYCETPIEVCESRDVKGLYARARNAVAEGKGLGFTGVDDPYEPPLHPEVTLDTSTDSVEVCVGAIIEKLIALGYLPPQG